jgi:hypothetical protein
MVAAPGVNPMAKALQAEDSMTTILGVGSPVAIASVST